MEPGIPVPRHQPPGLSPVSATSARYSFIFCLACGCKGRSGISGLKGFSPDSIYQVQTPEKSGCCPSAPQAGEGRHTVASIMTVRNKEELCCIVKEKCIPVIFWNRTMLPRNVGLRFERTARIRFPARCPIIRYSRSTSDWYRGGSFLVLSPV